MTGASNAEHLYLSISGVRLEDDGLTAHTALLLSECATPGELPAEVAHLQMRFG